MSRYQNIKSAYASLISMVSIYILLIILILFFADKVLLGVATGGSLFALKYIPFALVLPIFLIATIIFNISKLIRQREKKQAGSNLKSKLVLFFTFITILPSIPLGILAVNLTNAITKSWLSSGVEDALRGGLDIAIEYNRSIMDDIAVFRDSVIFENIILNLESSPEIIWRNITGAFPRISSISIYDSEGNKTMFMGDETASVDFSLLNLDNNTLTRSKENDRSIIRTRKDFFPDENLTTVVLTILLPKNFDYNAKELTKALQLFSKNRKYHGRVFLRLILFYIYFSLPIILLSILTSFLLSEEIIQPIAHLQEAIRRVVEGDYSYRVLTHSNDDFLNLVNSFNYMVSELELSRKNLVQSEKVSVWQEIAQRMAHEIKNPLTPIKLSAQRILKKYKQSPDSIGTILEPAVDAIIKEVENLTQLLTQFKDFSKMPSPLREKVALKNLIIETSLLYSESYQSITLDFEGLEDIHLKIDKGQIQRVFSNLITNSFSSITGRGTVSFRTELIRKGNMHYCRIQITDTGSGIDPDLKNKIFNPYFTTKEKGTGLGLPIVERIISDHKGIIWYESELEMGTTFFIELPMGNLE